MHKKQYFLCAICNKRCNRSHVKGFLVPNCPIRRKRWIQFCQINFTEKAMVCEKHFPPSAFVNGRKIRLQPGALPILKGFGTESTDERVKNETAQTKEVGGCQAYNGIKLADACFQTEENVAEVQELQQRLMMLEEENRKICYLLNEARQLQENVKGFFTNGQIRRLLNNKTNWDSEEISNAISLHTESPDAYRHLYQKGFPLPSISTLQKWASNDLLKSKIQKP